MNIEYCKCGEIAVITKSDFVDGTYIKACVEHYFKDDQIKAVKVT